MVINRLTVSCALVQCANCANISIFNSIERPPTFLSLSYHSLITFLSLLRYVLSQLYHYCRILMPSDRFRI